MTASFTRIGVGSFKRDTVLVDESFQVPRFSLTKSAEGWILDPGRSGNVINVIPFNGKASSGPRPIVDDDHLKNGPDWYTAT